MAGKESPRKYSVNLNIIKGYTTIQVEAEDKDQAEDTAWSIFENMTIGELHKLETEIETEEEP